MFMAKKSFGRIKNAHSVNVRKDPGTNSAIVSWLRFGTPIYILGTSGGSGADNWARIQTLDSTINGWVSFKYIVNDVSIFYISGEPTADINVRKGPGIEYPVVNWIYAGDMIDILDLDETTNWYKIKNMNNTIKGWASAKFIRIYMTN